MSCCSAYPGGTRIRHDVDGLLRPGTTELLDAADTPRAYRAYQYNLENHIVRIDSETGEHLYTYDELYRLIEARFAEEMGLQNEAYTYDGVANRLTEGGGEPWEYNENHQLTSKPGATFEYDANGHTVRKVEQDGTVTLYEYDLAERLRQVRIEGGAILGSYRYDPFGRRISKTTQEGTIYFHYDESGLLAEYDISGSLISEYQYWPGSPWMTSPLFMRSGNASEVSYYYNGHSDHPLKLFDASGSVVWRAVWTAYGLTRISEGAITNNLRFPGQYFDQETGILHKMYRDYDPRQGRYLQADPLGLLGGFNIYVYAEANPVHNIDYHGLSASAAIRAGASAGALAGSRIGALGGPKGVIIGGAIGGGLGAALGGPSERRRSNATGDGSHAGDHEHDAGKDNCDNCLDCSPPSGSRCVVRHGSDRGNKPHRDHDNHWHTFQMNQDNNCKCRWQQVSDKKGGTVFGPTIYPNCPFSNY